mgnify:CR=1 FL=1
MKNPRRKLFGYTWVGYLNFFFIQWFFVRLAYIIDTDTKENNKYTLLKRVVPLTGCWSDYKYI